MRLARTRNSHLEHRRLLAGPESRSNVKLVSTPNRLYNIGVRLHYYHSITTDSCSLLSCSRQRTNVLNVPYLAIACTLEASLLPQEILDAYTAPLYRWLYILRGHLGPATKNVRECHQHGEPPDAKDVDVKQEPEHAFEALAKHFKPDRARSHNAPMPAVSWRPVVW